MVENLATELVVLNGEIGPQNIRTIGIVSSVFGTISTLGCLFTMITTIRSNKSQHALGKMVILASLMEILCSFSSMLNFLPNIKESNCQIQGFMIGFGRGGAIFWYCCFAHSLNVCVGRNDVQAIGTFMKRYIFFSFPIATLLGYFSIGVYKIKQVYPICAHCNTLGSLELGEMLTYLLPSLLGVAVCLYYHISTIRKLIQFEGANYSELLLYPLVLIICNFPVAVIELYAQLSSASEIPWLLTLGENVLFYSQGLLNALISGLSGRERENDRGYTMANDRFDTEYFRKETTADRSRRQSSWARRTITAVPADISEYAL